MVENNHRDVMIIGGGTMGTAAAWALAKRGVKPLVLERFAHFHSMGSHGGDTRVIRHVYAESPEYVPLVQQADRLWQELEAEISEPVLVRCGGLELAAPGFAHARAARASADEHGLPYEWLTAMDVSQRWPTIQIPSNWDALFSPDSGFLLNELALRGMASLARQRGATIVENAPVTGWGTEQSGIWAETPVGRFTADAAIVTPGAWSSRVLSDLELPLHVRRKTLWWQEVNDPVQYFPDRFPVFIADSPAGEIYGFPIHGTAGLKIANHQGGDVVDPETVVRSTGDGENADCLELANLLFSGVTSSVVKSTVCLYTMTPDSDFIIDRHPGDSRVVIGTGFSGHGFKFAPAIGELLAELLVSQAASPSPRFSISRFH